MKSVLITGTSRGIGRALCEEALRRGYAVHAVVRASGSAPKGCEEHVADIRDRERMRKLLAELAPKVDVFIANAGVGGAFSPKDPKGADRVAEIFEINGTATAYSLCAMASEWVRAGARDRRLVSIASISAGRGVPRNGAYVATKTAELILCQSLERDLDRYGIGVSAVLPGFVDTEMSKGLSQRPFLLTPTQAAQKTWNGIERGTFYIAFPAPTRMAMWVLNHMPYFLFRALMRFMLKRKMV